MAFENTPLLELVSYSFTGGPRWETEMVTMRSGIVKRNSLQELPVYEFSAPYAGIQKEHNDMLLAAYHACRGPLHSFRFRDWADYQFINENLGTATVNGVNQFQCQKKYIFGSSSFIRPITKPRNGTYLGNLFSVTVTVDDVITPATVDDLTGIIEVSAAVDQVVKATGEFDVPVYFADTDLKFNFEDYDAHTTQIGLKEDLSA